ncbi:hypothetical protein LXL04_036391 [Taraxacum kok-saghyz]
MVPGSNRVQSSEAPLWETGLLRMMLLSLRGGFEPGIPETAPVVSLINECQIQGQCQGQNEKSRKSWAFKDHQTLEMAPIDFPIAPKNVPIPSALWRAPETACGVPSVYDGGLGSNVEYWRCRHPGRRLENEGTDMNRGTQSRRKQKTLPSYTIHAFKPMQSMGSY